MDTRIHTHASVNAYVLVCAYMHAHVSHKEEAHMLSHTQAHTRTQNRVKRISRCLLRFCLVEDAVGVPGVCRELNQSPCPQSKEKTGREPVVSAHHVGNALRHIFGKA